MSIENDRLVDIILKVGNLQQLLMMSSHGKDDPMLVQAVKLSGEVLQELYALKNGVSADVQEVSEKARPAEENEVSIADGVVLDGTERKRYTFINATVDKYENLGYVFLKGSFLAAEEKDSIPRKAHEERKRLREEGYLSDKWQFIKDSDLIRIRGESTICAMICGYAVAPKLKEK
ncbi:hypothetical protein [Ruminococcus sp.]|uniref:hypothetical protein n=1 Tax=Ruminococcus sp. TaxID=41978 RepID=UPI0025DF6ACC|nr:hypothetical protein [Ruminococcus sp.]MBQ8965895.1 hypothetical protein [Ruminococcus sp.]